MGNGVEDIFFQSQLEFRVLGNFVLCFGQRTEKLAEDTFERDVELRSGNSILPALVILGS